MCKSINDYSNIPSIEFVKHKAQTSEDALGNKTHKVQIEFYITDGDGNVGLPNNAKKPYVGDSAFNYFSELFYLENGKWLNDTLVLSSTKNFIIPYLDNFLGSNKLLKANVFIDYEYVSLLFKHDTIKYSFYVLDRDFNKSNVAFSDTIVLK